MKRPLVLLVAAAVAALLLSACGSTGEPDAATVGSTSISRSQLDDELTTIAANKALAKALEGQNPPLDVTPTAGSVSPVLSTFWLTTLVNQVLVDQAFEARNLTVSPQNKADAKTQAETVFSNADVFAKFPKEFREKVLRRQERIEAVKSSLPAQAPPTDAALEQLLESSKAEICPSGTVVAHILVATQAEADAVEDALAFGADFADLAQERSTDSGSGDLGGLVACTDTAQFQQLTESFRLTAQATPPGTVSAPVQTEFGYHIIKVAPWELEIARPVIEQAYAQQQAQNTPYDQFLNRQLAGAKLWVDPRYGTIQRSAQGVAIAPPQAPAVQDRPATTTTTGPAAGQQVPSGQAPSSQTPIPAP